jgi:hypothetical protein
MRCHQCLCDQILQALLLAHPPPVKCRMQGCTPPGGGRHALNPATA